MVKNKRKRVGKREIVQFIFLYLASNHMKMSKAHIIIPVVNAFIFAINTLLEKGIEINLRGFGNFIIKDINRDKCIVGGKEYKIKKKRKVVFKYLNRNFSNDCKVAQLPEKNKFSTRAPLRKKHNLKIIFNKPSI